MIDLIVRKKCLLKTYLYLLYFLKIYFELSNHSRNHLYIIIFFSVAVKIFDHVTGLS